MGSAVLMYDMPHTVIRLRHIPSSKSLLRRFIGVYMYAPDILLDPEPGTGSMVSVLRRMKFSAITPGVFGSGFAF